MKYSLGPILYFWDRQRVVDFYDNLKDSDFDIIYIGETVCSKRRELKTGEWIELAKMLRDSGKQVVLSTMALLEAQSEVATVKSLCDNGEFMVEANDMSGVHFMAEQQLPFVVGAAVNIYNHFAIQQLLQLGMQRWVMPVELSRDWLANILSQYRELAIDTRFETEVFSFGHLPLAYSARCFTARSEQRPKDDCQFCCINYPNGRVIRSQDNHELFVINGIQTMSGKRYNLIKDQSSMASLVDVVRLSPEQDDMQSVLSAFKSHTSKSHTSTQTLAAEAAFNKQTDVNGYWHSICGMQNSPC